MCPECGSRRVSVLFDVPKVPAARARAHGAVVARDKLVPLANQLIVLFQQLGVPNHDVGFLVADVFSVGVKHEPQRLDPALSVRRDILKVLAHFGVESERLVVLGAQFGEPLFAESELGFELLDIATAATGRTVAISATRSLTPPPSY
jgi:hypothetical protein